MGITVNNNEINDCHLLSTDYMPDTLHFSTWSEVVVVVFFPSLYFSDRRFKEVKNKNEKKPITKLRASK